MGTLARKCLGPTMQFSQRRRANSAYLICERENLSLSLHEQEAEKNYPADINTSALGSGAIQIN